MCDRYVYIYITNILDIHKYGDMNTHTYIYIQYYQYYIIFIYLYDILCTYILRYPTFSHKPPEGHPSQLRPDR